MKITIDIDESAGPSTTVQADAPAAISGPGVAAAAPAHTAIDAGACAEPTAAAFFAELSESAPDDASTSAGEAPDL